MPGPRHVRRQGVVYGPITTRLHRDGQQSAIGRMLGISIVLLALIVLFTGSTLFLIGGSGPTATPTTVAASPSPSVEPSPSVPVTPAPPTIEPPPPTPTPFALAVEQGPGYVTFGTDYDSDDRITDPATSFPFNRKVSWSAELATPVDTGELQLRIYRYDVAADQEQLVLERPVEMTADQTLFTDAINPKNKLSGEGVYVVRYEVDEEILAEGWFEAIR